MNNKQQWFSASELLGLPGIPVTEKGLRRQAIKLDWRWQNRSSERGRPCKEYHISSLPPETQEYLKQQVEPDQLHSQPESGNEGGDVDYPERSRIGEQGMGNGELPITNVQYPMPNAQYPIPDTQSPVTHHLSPDIPAPKPRKKRGKGSKDEDRINAKVEILRCLDCFCKDKGLPKIRCHYAFAQAYSDGQIEVSVETRKCVPNLSPATLQRWVKTLEKGNIQALGGKYGHRAGDTKIDAFPKVRDAILGLITNYPHASGKQVLMALRGMFEGEILPSQRTVERWINNWKQENKELFTAVANPDRWKNSFMTAQGSYSEHVVRLNQEWEKDSTPADIALKDGRYKLIGGVDVYSRRLKFLVVPQSKAVHIGTLLRRCLLDWGVPELVKTDNGKDYTANYLQRLFLSLNITQKLCEPFCPWQKPHIERAFRTFGEDLLELLPGYIGHDVAERQELRARQSFSDRLMKKNEVIEVKLTAAEFQAFCDNWTDGIYAHRVHGELKCSPFEKANSWRGTVKTISDERVLDILLAEAPGANGLRVVQKKGIQLEGTWFVAPELGLWVGQTVQVRLDPLDMGKIYVFDGDFKLICIAEDPARTGISRKEVAVKARQMQQERVSAGRKALRRLGRDVKPTEVIEAILVEAEDRTGNVIRFPGKSEEHETPAMRSANDVIEALQPKKYLPMSAEELADADAAFMRIEAEAKQPDFIRDGDYFKRLLRKIKAGREIAADDKNWMLHYITTPSGKGCLLFLEMSEEQFHVLLAS
jgi:hypothetical protein